MTKDKALEVLFLALLLSLGTMSIIHNVHDILRMRRAISSEYSFL